MVTVGCEDQRIHLHTASREASLPEALSGSGVDPRRRAVVASAFDSFDSCRQIVERKAFEVIRLKALIRSLFFGGLCG